MRIARMTMSICLSALLICAFEVRAQTGKAEPKNGRWKEQVASLQGVWEQTSARIFPNQFNGPDSDFMHQCRRIMIINGNRVYTISNNFLRFSIRTERIADTANAPSAIDLVCPADKNSIARLLYEWNGDTLDFCFNGADPSHRPQKITPSAKNEMADAFKRLKVDAKAKRDQNPKKMEPFAGLWVATEIERDGEKLVYKRDNPADAKEKFGQRHKVIFFNENTFTLVHKQNFLFDVDVVHSTFMLPSKDEKEIDFRNREGGNFALGIYECKGEHLTLCWTRKGKRPSEFRTRQGDGLELIRFKLADPEK